MLDDAAARPVLRVRGVTKTFPGVRALDDVSLEVASGEVVALLGQNGSGKSTLVKILSGVHSADAGSVRIGLPGSAHDALHVIHQDLGLIEGLSAVENLTLGRGSRRGSLAPLRRRAELASARAAIERFGVELDVRAPVARLTPAQRTVVAIARALDGWAGASDLLVLDEPTATLPSEEAQTLFAAVRQVARDGAGVLFISHHLEEVTVLADRAVVLRDGRLVADVPTDGLTPARIAELITGSTRPVVGSAPAPRDGGGRPALTVRSLSGGGLRGMDLEVWPGEVVGVTGLLGSGREHLAGLVFGAVPRSAGTVEVRGRALTGANPHESIRHGVALVPADRRAHGGVMTHSLRENISLPELGSLCRARLHLRPRQERAEAAEWVRRVEISPAAPEQSLGLFSGGNQQKAVLARWLRTAPSVLLVEEPTQGVDVGASEAVRALITGAAAGGAAVLVTSSDNADLTRMCSRVVVLRGGAPAAELHGGAITDSRITQECLGASPEDPARRAPVEVEA